MIRSSRSMVGGLVLILGLTLIGSNGCATEDIFGPQREPSAQGRAAENSPEATVAPVPLAGRTEADLVSELVRHRTMYTRYLEALATFYSEHGLESKAAWARNELRSFSLVKQGAYLSDNDLSVAAPDATPGANVPDIKLKDSREQDLVEEMLGHRRMYSESLRVLVAYYTDNALDHKANIARLELKGVQGMKKYKYMMDAEIPVAGLRPEQSIADADRMYDESMKLLGTGGHRVPIFFSRDTMNKALAKLKDLIAKYPTSDKIDDAAYYIAEIYKEYGEEKDNVLAVAWYKRAIEYNPQLPHPAWSHCAHVLDFRMHEREQALEWYYKVLENEKDKTGPRFWKNIDVANKRIAELTSEKTRYAPAEPTPPAEVRPEPTPSAAPAGK